MASLETGSDTASDDDECDFGSEHGGSFRVHALTRVPKTAIVKPAPSRICHVNKFAGLEVQQEYDANVMDSLNTWAHKVRVAPKRCTQLASTELPNSKLDRTVNYINGGKKCGPDPRTDEDIVVKQMVAAAPSSKISAARAARTIGSWELADG